MIVDVLVYQRIRKSNLVVVFHFQGEVNSLLLCVHVQKKVIDSESCGDYEGVVDVSLQIRGSYSGGHDLLLFKILHK